MSSIANITVFDGAATPVSHTLVGISVSRKEDEVVAVWREMNATLPVYAQITCTMKMVRMKSGVYRVSTRVEVPVMESVGTQNAAGYTAPPKVAYTNTVELIGYFHERSTITERRLARMIGINLGNNVSTSVAAATTGFVPELVDQLITAS